MFNQPLHRVLPFAVAAVLALGACGPRTVPAVPTATVAAQVAASTATLPTAAPTAAPTTAPAQPAGPSASANGVRFVYDPSLATGVRAELVPAATEQGPYWTVGVQHVAFTLDGYPVKDAEAQIQVFTLNDYLQQQASGSPTINGAEELRSILAQKPDLNQRYQLFSLPQNGIAESAPPLIPPINALVQLAAHKGYVAFANGSGLRFVYWASQGPAYIDPARLFYTYEGLTSDGKHIVVATFPVQVQVKAAIPAITESTTPDDVNQLNQTLAAEIEAAGPASFNPPLPALDAMLQSIQVAPEAP